jgi:hypothetical protein
MGYLRLVARGHLLRCMSHLVHLANVGNLPGVRFAREAAHCRNRDSPATAD